MIEPVTAAQMQADYATMHRTVGTRISMTAKQMARTFLLNKGILLKDAAGPDRTKAMAIPRQECMAYLIKHTDLGYSAVGRIFNRDHSTVVHAVRVVAHREGLLQ